MKFEIVAHMSNYAVIFLALHHKQFDTKNICVYCHPNYYSSFALWGHWTPLVIVKDQYSHLVYPDMHKIKNLRAQLFIEVARK